MKILFFISQLHHSGGMEHTVVDKANFLSNCGHDVMFVTYANKGKSTYFKLSANVKWVDVDCRYFEAYKLPIFKRLLFLIKKKKEFRTKLAQIIHYFNPDVIDIVIPNTTFFIYDLVKIAKSVKIILECHIANSIPNMKKPPTFERLLYVFNKPHKAIKKIDLIIALTFRDAKYWQSLQVKNIRVIPNPITFPPIETEDSEKEVGRILAVGRLDSQKRFDRLIESFAIIAWKYPIWHIDIYGDGNEKDSLEKQIASLGLSNRVVIHSTTSKIYKEYQKSQFLVLSSDYEGLPLVILESMACGTPVLSCDCPNVSHQ